MDHMLQISDNSATDMILEVAGGPEAVTGRMGELRFGGIRVDRPTVELIAGFLGVEELPRPETATRDAWERLVDGIPEAARDSARAAFERNPEDTATPREMVRLLRGIRERAFLSEASVDGRRAGVPARPGAPAGLRSRCGRSRPLEDRDARPRGGGAGSGARP